MMDNLSIADALALKGNENNGFGGNGGGDFLLILILFLFFGMNGNGFGQNGFGGAATAATQNEILMGQQFDRVNQKQDAIAQGLCDSTYALNNSIKECCCNTQLLGKDILAGIHAEGEATRAMIQSNEVQNLRDKVTDLQVGLSQCRQNEYLVNKLTPPCPVPAYITCSPYQSYNPCGCNGFQPNI